MVGRWLYWARLGVLPQGGKFLKMLKKCVWDLNTRPLRPLLRPLSLVPSGFQPFRFSNTSASVCKLYTSAHSYTHNPHSHSYTVYLYTHNPYSHSYTAHPHTHNPHSTAHTSTCHPTHTPTAYTATATQPRNLSLYYATAPIQPQHSTITPINSTFPAIE